MDYKIEKITEDCVDIISSSDKGDTKCTYMNTTSSRKLLKDILPIEDYDMVLETWGERLTISDPPQVSEESLLERKNEVIKSMSEHCNEAITNGFDIALSDDSSHHFSLEITDQLKIQALALKAQAGETALPYHADGEPCRYFSPQEIAVINVKMEEIITYNTTYFNSLRDYINSVSTFRELNYVEYGMPIPVEYQSEVLKELIKNGEVTGNV